MEINEFGEAVRALEHVDVARLPSLLQELKASLKAYETDYSKLGVALYKLAEQLMRTKDIKNEQAPFYQDLLCIVIRMAIGNDFRVGFDAMRFIFNLNADYYKSANLDLSLAYPIGKDHPLPQYSPAAGEECDVVRPYITSTSFCGWTRCTVLEVDNNKYTLQYANTANPSILREKPWFAPLGSRTQDYDWRMGLDMGAHVEALLNRVWYKATVSEVGMENGSKRVRVTYRRFDQKGDKVDSQGNRYFGLGIGEDEWLDVLSSRIQQCGKMVDLKLCYYTFTSEQIVLDDSYDIIFEKEFKESPFYAIMRVISCKSLSLIKFIDTFAASKGIEKTLEVMGNPDINDEIVYHVLTSIGMMVPFFPRMFIKHNPLFQDLYSRVFTYMVSTAKSLNNYKLEIGYFCYDALGRRLFSLSEVHRHQNELRKALIRQFLKMNMEKQMLALRYLNDLIYPKKDYNEEERAAFNKFLKDENIFGQIFNSNTHEQIITRTVSLLQYLIQKEIISSKQFESLWKIAPATDTRGRAMVEKLLTDIAKNIPMAYVDLLIEKILQLRETELTVENLNLLRELKNRDIDTQSQMKILTFLWDLLTVKSGGVKQAIEEEVEKVFKGFVSTMKNPKVRMSLLESMCQKLQDCKRVRNQIELLKDFIKSYPHKYEPKDDPVEDNEGAPLTIYDAVSFLKNKGIYIGLLNLLSRTKDEAVKKDILRFYGFLFQNDFEDINPTLKLIYEKLGPSINFLEWVHKLLDRSLTFVIELLETTTDFSPFERINENGFDSIQGMIIDVNNTKKNIKKLKGNGSKSKSSGDNKKGDKSKKEEEKKLTSTLVPELKYSFSVLVSPFKLIGMKFLEHLLLVVKQSRIYDAIIKLIIQFISNLDESIESKTEDFRREFLEDMVKEIKAIAQDNKMEEKTKAKLTVYVNLLFEIFGETEKYGIGDIQPHFQSVEGEMVSLNIENLVDKERSKNNPGFIPKFTIVCNQNFTMWRLKQRMGEIISIDPQLIDIIKYSDPMADTLNCKSLEQLMFYDNENIKVAKKAPKSVLKANLLNEEGTDVSEKLEKMIKILFNQYKNMDTNGIGMRELETLANERWKGSLFRQTEWLLKMLEEHDKERKGYLTLNDFKEFFYVKSIKSESAVWRIVNLSGWKNNLSSSSTDVEVVAVNTSALPRRILSSPEVFDLIFSILDNDNFKEVHLSFYKLIEKLEDDQRVKAKVQANPYLVLTQNLSPYRLCYSLEVLNSELAKKAELYYSFWQNNGVELVSKKLEQYFEGEKAPNSFSEITKHVIVPGLLGIQQMYTRELLSNLKIVRFISVSKINHFDPKDFIKKVNELNTSKDAPQLTDVGKKLRELNAYEGILKRIFVLADCILHSLMSNYGTDKAEYLQKITVQVVRLVGSLIASNEKYHSFEPLGYLEGIKNASLNYRRSSIILIYIYLFYSENPKQEQTERIIKEMLEQMPKENKFEFEEYFLILNELVFRYLQMNIETSDKDDYFISLANRLLDTVFNEVEGESRNSYSSDRIITGILEIVDSLITKDSVGRALAKRKEEITEKCLFAYDIEEKLKHIEVIYDMLSRERQEMHFKNYVICKNENSRALAYRIVARLHELSQEDSQEFLNKYIVPVVRSIGEDVRTCSNRSLAVGLKNFGSTCYMNSMLQVLNTVSPFRNSLMKVSSESGVIKELKKLFASLYFSERVDYAPRELLASFVPPINPGIQQDTTEFLNFLFDQLEAGLSTTRYRKLLDELFKGANTAQMICHSCGYKKENREEFFSFGVEIEGKTDLHSALEGSYQGETIFDYLCDSCKNKGETTKRNILSEIPNIMFIHLRRIVFNYDMFVNMKIHSRLQFPQELNIEPYTKEGVELRETLGLEYMKNLAHNEEELKKFEKLAEHGKEKDYYKMKLKGIIVHSGSADVGHYYSILQYDNCWRKFDDSRIGIFTPSDFETYCYGGSFVADEWGSGTSANAYVLVYEKVVKNPIEIMAEEEGKPEEVLKYEDFKIYNSPDDYRQLWLDNHSFMVESQLLDSKTGKYFLNFVCRLLTDSPKCSNKMEIISQIVYRISFHSGYIGDMPRILVPNASEATPDLLYTYVLKDKVRTFKLLFHYEKVIRDFMAVYLQIILMESYRKGDEKVKADVLAYIAELLSMLPVDAAKNWMRIDGYFKLFFLLVSCAICFIDMWKFFLSKNLISTFIDFLLEKQSPVKINPKNHSVGTKTNPMDFTYAISTICFLVRHSYGLTGKNYETASIPQQFLFHLNNNDVTCLSHMDLYRKLLRERQNSIDLSGIIHRLCIKNIGFSKAICEVMLETVNSITDSKDEMYDLSNICLEIIKIKDELWSGRAELLLGVGMPSVMNQNLLTTFDEETFVYSSTICDIFPAESIIAYAYLFRLQNTLACFQLVRAIIQGCSVSEEAMKYLVRQPSPSYLYPSLVSWMECFIQTFIGFVTVEKKHRERLEEEITNTMKYVEDLKKYMADHPDTDFYRPLITGEIGNKKELLAFEKDGVEIKLNEYEVYCLESRPTTTGNLAMDTYLQQMKTTKNISSNSNLWRFFKKSGKSIALKLAPVEEDEDKEIKSLFDDDYPTVVPPPKEQTVKENEVEDEFELFPEQKQKEKEVKQPVEKDKEKQQEVEINLDGVFVNNYFRELEVVNKSKEKKVIELFFSFGDNCNFVTPKSFAWKIASKANQSLWMAKQNWQDNWGDLQMNCNILDYVKEKHDKKSITSWWFKTYGIEEVEEVEEPQPSEQKQAEKPEEKKAVEQAVEAKTDEGEANNEGNEGSEYIACPTCTYNNHYTNTNCELCDTPLS